VPVSRPAQLDRLPPQAFFLVSAVFHYLGPALAVLLFARVDVLGVAWLRIASAALVFAAWRRPWRLLTEPRRRSHRRHLRLLLALGAALGGVLAAMNTCFYLPGALPAFTRPGLLLAGIGVGVCSSVIPYVTDQLAMARLPRATFALMLALLPVFAAVTGAIVLRQFPTPRDIAGIALVTAGVALHQERK
jgi:threonine/homoserine efflux transporter RhtA